MTRYTILFGMMVLLGACIPNQNQNENETSDSTCGEEFLPEGTNIMVDEPVFFVTSDELLLIPNGGINVVHTNEELQSIFESEAFDASIPQELIDFDFSQQEIIIFFMERRNNDPLFCFNGLVELPDESRALTMGLIECNDCDFGPRYTFYYLVIPLSQTETALYIATNFNDASDFAVATDSLDIE